MCNREVSTGQMEQSRAAPELHCTRGAEAKPDLAELVQVRRQPGDWRLAAYRLSDIARLRWDFVGGGIRRKSQWHVYGFVMCNGMVHGRIAHSCAHGPPPHRIKVCITRKYNEKIWPLISTKVGPKPLPRRRRRSRRT
jgi:hypothetical protein